MIKNDLNWILTDKLPDTLGDKIQKYEDNGMRSYKKLFIWSVDIGEDAKQISMNEIMNPAAAKTDEILADAIEKWDFART